ncbi:MAG: type III pantothenate kinase [Bacteroidota bacterium]|nr:type III pantothenate kinase [Bacteroidota bacterium]
MFLACDLGNTFAKFGLYEHNELKRFIKCPYEEFSADVFQAWEIDRIGISSVVPQMTEKIAGILSEKFTYLPFIINSASSRFNLKINYKSPSTLGIDRICSAEGAFSLFRSDPDFSKYNENTFIVTADLGTATTINIVGYYAEFLGGIIMPGISTMANSLFTNTAKLPRVDPLDAYKGFIGIDTASSISSGIINSTSGIIERTVMRLKKEQNAQSVKLYLTGGFAEVMKNYVETDSIVVKDLVLRGIKAIYERNFVDKERNIF